MRDGHQVQLRSGYPPRAETPFAFQGRYPGLRNRACRLPMVTLAFRRPVSPQWHRGTPLQSLTVAGAAQE